MGKRTKRDTESTRATEPRVEHRSGNDERFTPSWMFDLVRKLGPIYLDPATTVDNPAGAEMFFTREDDGLSKHWGSYGKGVIWLNPPYSRVSDWARKCIAETRLCEMPLFFLCATRTGSRWFNAMNRAADCRIDWHERIKFSDEESGAPFDSTLFLIGGDGAFRKNFRKLFEHFGFYIPLRTLRQLDACDLAIEQNVQIDRYENDDDPSYTISALVHGNGKPVGVAREGLVKLDVNELQSGA